jgi:hypothetical protein
MKSALLRGVACICASSCFTSSAPAQQSTPPKDSAVTIVGVKVVAEKGDATRVTPLQLSTLPAIVAITMPRVVESVNLLDTEDAVKYMPTVFLRKRNNGDTQATLGTRT